MLGRMKRSPRTPRHLIELTAGIDILEKRAEEETATAIAADAAPPLTARKGRVAYLEPHPPLKAFTLFTPRSWDGQSTPSLAGTRSPPHLTIPLHESGAEGPHSGLASRISRTSVKSVKSVRGDLGQSDTIKSLPAKGAFAPKKIKRTPAPLKENMWAGQKTKIKKFRSFKKAADTLLSAPIADLAVRYYDRNARTFERAMWRANYALFDLFPAKR